MTREGNHGDFLFKYENETVNFGIIPWPDQLLLPILFLIWKKIDFHNTVCYVIVFIVSYREITNSRFSLTQSKPCIFWVSGPNKSIKKDLNINWLSTMRIWIFTNVSNENILWLSLLTEKESSDTFIIPRYKKMVHYYLHYLHRSVIAKVKYVMTFHYRILSLSTY